MTTKTVQEIREAILSLIDTTLSKLEGTLLWKIINALSFALKEIYIVLEDVYTNLFVSSAYGEGLTNRCKEHGVNRKSATVSKGIIRIEGNQGVFISKNSVVMTEDEKKYITNYDVQIVNSYVDVEVTSILTGFYQNCSVGSIKKFENNISGVTSVTNLSEIGGGADEETDDALRERFFEIVNNPITSGNINHFKMWAKEIPGISEAQVEEGWNGPLTIKLYCINDNKLPSSQQSCDDAKVNIINNQPVGALPTVTPAIEKSIDIQARLILESGYNLEFIKTSILEKIATELKNIAFKQSYLSYAKISSIIVNTQGVKDLSNLLINNGTGIIDLNIGEVAVLKTLTFTV